MRIEVDNQVHAKRLHLITSPCSPGLPLPQDDYCYCGTSTGDLLQVGLANKLFNNIGPKMKTKRENFSQGILASSITPFGDVLIGAGDGTLSLTRPDLNVFCQAKVSSGITSIVLTNDVFTSGPHAGSFAFLCGTQKCDMYYVRYIANENRLVCELEQTNHFEQINDIAFPAEYSALFATCSGCDIRVWHATEYRELMRIQVSRETVRSQTKVAIFVMNAVCNVVKKCAI